MPSTRSESASGNVLGKPTGFRDNDKGFVLRRDGKSRCGAPANIKDSHENLAVL